MTKKQAKELSAFVKKHIESANLSAYSVEMNFSFSWVNIQLKTDNAQDLQENRVFLQGHDADQFNDDVKALFEKSQYLTMPECALYVASTSGYLDLIGQ
jgi:hypothetical protein